MGKINALVEETMAKMEERGFTVREAEAFPRHMKEEIRRNGELIEKEKQFTVFSHEDQSL